ncbi:HAD hydrolase-like protein [Streptococcus sp. S784/96/1]|uniref:HAD hydrolase-like protein n=1 Tax=Streptococcus sp. S784/96/1 TaxID=2653499 RepID=UPI001EE46210|nr:HAD hydrolase-like protein [Streptococcus sp. S784/96/1]
MPRPKMTRTFIGPPLEDSFRQYVDDVDKAVTIYRDYYKNIGVFEVKLYPCIEQLLKELVANHFNLYITSSKNEPMIHVMLKHLNIDRFFTGIYGHTCDRNNKIKVIEACLLSENINQKMLLLLVILNLILLEVKIIILKHSA